MTMTLGSIIHLQSPSSTSALSTSINAFQLVTGAAELQNGSNFVSIPGINVSVPGILPNTLAVALKVISPAQIAEGPVGTQANNAQIVLQIKFNLSVLGLLNPAQITLNEANATAVATLTDIRCSSNPGVTISAATGALTTTGTAVVALLGSMNITGSGAGTSATAHDFGYTSNFVPPVGSGTYWETGASTLGINDNVTVTGAGALGATAALIQPVLNTTLGLLDPALSTVLKPVLQALGANLSAADVSAINIFPAPPACGRPGLLK
jgi:uncharacterized membrane protein